MGEDHLLLAHDVVKEENRDTYMNLFRNRLDLGLVILDNSVVELGHAVDPEMILLAAKITRPSHIVIPDAYLDADKTMALLNQHLSAMYKQCQKLPNKPQLMYLPQGKTVGDFAACAAYYAHDEQIGSWGIPRNIVEYHGSRKTAIMLCKDLNPSRMIHMFGFSDDLVDDLICSQFPEVNSIDSAVPVREPFFSFNKIVPPRGKWWETARPSATQVWGIQKARRLFAGEGLS